jgi:hypothetical protein
MKSNLSQSQEEKRKKKKPLESNSTQSEVEESVKNYHLNPICLRLNKVQNDH